MNAKKMIILSSLRGKMKEYKLDLEAGKIVFDIKDNRTMIFTSDNKKLLQNNNVEESVKNMFLKLAEKQVGEKINIMIWDFDFPNKKFNIECCLANGTKQKTEL